MLKFQILKKSETSRFDINFASSNSLTITNKCSLLDLQQKNNELIPTALSNGISDQDAREIGGAVDKDLSSIFVTHVENGGAWFKMEFGKSEFIHEVTFFTRFYKDWYRRDINCVQSIEQFKSCIDESNNVDVSVYQGGQGEVQQKSCGTLQMTYGLEQSDQVYTLLCNIEGDSIKLSKTTGDRIAFHEIVVTGKGLKSLSRFPFQTFFMISATRKHQKPPP